MTISYPYGNATPRYAISMLMQTSWRYIDVDATLHARHASGIEPELFGSSKTVSHLRVVALC